MAERIASRLGERGLEAEVRSFDDVADAAGYDAFALGSAVANMAWLTGAAGFVRRNAGALAERPVWLFSVGSRDALSGPIGHWMKARYPQPKQIAAFREQIYPCDCRIFTGVIDPAHYPFVSRLVMKVLGVRYGDYRDWDRSTPGRRGSPTSWRPCRRLSTEARDSCGRPGPPRDGRDLPQILWSTPPIRLSSGAGGLLELVADRA